MLKTYRVITLSLVTALFFAAPLLCVQPISFQIKKAQHAQEKRMRVASLRGTHNPRMNTRNASASWARSIHRTGYETFHPADPATTRGEDERLYENYRSEWDVSHDDAGMDAMESPSYSDL